MQVPILVWSFLHRNQNKTGQLFLLLNPCDSGWKASGGGNPPTPLPAPTTSRHGTAGYGPPHLLLDKVGDVHPVAVAGAEAGPGPSVVASPHVVHQRQAVLPQQPGEGAAARATASKPRFYPPGEAAGCCCRAARPRTLRIKNGLDLCGNRFGKKEQ